MLAEQIRNKKFLEDTIKELKKENPSADIQLLEKTIGALYLVESLVNTGLDFIFKGGTSLVLLLNEIKRFSVDVDIITEENKERVNQRIQNIIKSQDLFTRFEENKRENSASQRMDLQHYKFFFNSVTDDSEKYILLDVAFESNEYPKVIEKNIQNKKLKVGSNLTVKVPSIESILGDKLTVLAPKTTGISYNSNKELELMKQLYDVDKLFNEADNIIEIKESFINIANREINYRELREILYKDVLDDIEDFAKEIIFMQDKSKLEKISIGMRKIANFRLEKKFLIDKEVLLAASKVAYLVHLIKNNGSIIEKYGNADIQDIEIPKEYRKRLKVIKKINEEAYYYILKSLEWNKSVKNNFFYKMSFFTL